MQALDQARAELRELENEEVALRMLVRDPSANSEQLRLKFAALRASFARLSESGIQPLLASELATYSTALTGLEEKLDAHAATTRKLENALRRLPGTLGALIGSGLGSEATAELSAATSKFLCSALADRGTLDGELYEQLVGRIVWFAQQAETPEPFEAAADSVRAARAASLEHEESLASVCGVPLEAVRAGLMSAHDGILHDHAAALRARQPKSLAVIGLLAAMLAFLVFRMRLLASDSRAVKVELEQRVKERTEQLVRMNEGLRDQMSERRKAELKTRAAQTDAEVASQAKSEFLANMSHEIRTPMTAILGFSERLLDTGPDEAARKDAVETIRRNGEYLLQIINDILDLSKIEAGKLQVERITCPTVDSVKGVLDLLGMRASDKGLSLSVDYVGDVPEFIETDTIRLRQILLNLVGNAIKFTRSGGVLLRIECVDEPYEMTDRLGNVFTGVKPFMKFSVIDTGIGMSELQLGALFTPFQQADNSTTRTFGGTGLGLSISKSLCGLLGGRIEVASTPGQGSRFTFTLDPGRLQGIRFIAPASENVIPVPDLPQRAPELRVERECRVLLAEDGVDNQRLIRYVLERAGSLVTIVGNGQQALNHAMSGWMDGDPYDVILMDMQMPVMDGYTAVRELRASGYDRPIMALTAHAMQTDREKCLGVGCDAFCAKPINKHELIGLINQLTRSPAGQNTQPASRLETTPESDEMDDFDDDPEMLDLINQFVDDLQADVVALRAALEREDLEKITILAHQLKGCAGGYGFNEISEIAGRVETLAKTGEVGENLGRELEVLCTSCQGLKQR